jgi:hypothetical protein
VTEERIGPPTRQPGWQVHVSYIDEKGVVISHSSRVSLTQSRDAVVGEEHVVVQEAAIAIRSVIAWREGKR